MDFDVAEDSLVLIYDDTGETAPEVSIEQDTEQTNLHRILLEGEVIAHVTSDTTLTLEHITLAPQSVG